MRGIFRSLFPARSSRAAEIAAIRSWQRELRGLGDEALRERFRMSLDCAESMAIVVVVAERVLGLSMFDVQLHGALALVHRRIAEMQTGEGKTLACTPAVAWLALGHAGVHVMTVNDYLARRDARWMGGIYEFLGLTVGCIRRQGCRARRGSRI